ASTLYFRHANVSGAGSNAITRSNMPAKVRVHIPTCAPPSITVRRCLQYETAASRFSCWYRPSSGTMVRMNSSKDGIARPLTSFMPRESFLSIPVRLCARLHKVGRLGLPGHLAGALAVVQPRAQRAIDQRMAGVLRVARKRHAANQPLFLHRLANRVEGHAVVPFAQCEQA